jgi:hypothetical protein
VVFGPRAEVVFGPFAVLAAPCFAVVVFGPWLAAVVFGPLAVVFGPWLTVAAVGGLALLLLPWASTDEPNPNARNAARTIKLVQCLIIELLSSTRDELGIGTKGRASRKDLSAYCDLSDSEEWIAKLTSGETRNCFQPCIPGYARRNLSKA